MKNSRIWIQTAKIKKTKLKLQTEQKCRIKKVHKSNLALLPAYVKTSKATSQVVCFALL